MHAKTTTLILFYSFFLCLLIVLLAGCSAKFFTYKGAWVAEDNRITVQDGKPYKGSWQTRDVTIDYTHQKKMQNLQISGEVKLRRFLTMGFGTLDNLTLNLYMLDPDGIVLDSKLIRIFAYRLDFHTLGKMTFNKQFELPADTAAIAFGYSGRVSDGGGGIHGDKRGGQIDWSFWKVPGRKPSE
ncbi:hypothetical protein [Desulfobacula toluolica]|uniref:Lipoprotein n=1 Tax=Desulfobacula toluolica (strain DSM 7467 / Tol2) TaxID=651182 RepID=K0NCQ8_DESTT|nr:hypothetical protein [Desulfobacula toluolica]CCK82339.1 uncharacterized protein TOL2_C41830 [Desulfobacula toluolica Tol2]